MRFRLTGWRIVHSETGGPARRLQGGGRRERGLVEAHMKRAEEWAEAWARLPEALEERWRKAASIPERAAAAAEILAELLSEEAACCRLDGPDGPALAVRPEPRAADAGLR